MSAATDRRPIGIFDSGIGGLSVAAAIAELLPDEDLFYVADNARAPYGPQSSASILSYSREITRYLLSRGAKMVVVACNTATSIALDQLRAEFPNALFVGLEPAVKPAADGNRVGVMATKATLDSSRYLNLKRKYLTGKPVFEDPCIGLVPIIESEVPGSPVLRQKLSSIINPMLTDGLDTLVLGCTHYPMVKEDIQIIAGESVRVIDPSPAAARQVQRLLSTLNGEEGTDVSLPDIPEPGTRGRAHDFICTGNSVALQGALIRLPSLNRRRRLVVPNGKID